MVCRQDKFIYNKHSDMRWKNILPLMLNVGGWSGETRKRNYTQ